MTMHPKRLMLTTAAILAIGFASVAGAEQDRRSPDSPPDHQPDKAEQQQRKQREPQQKEPAPKSRRDVANRGQQARPTPPPAQARPSQRTPRRQPAAPVRNVIRSPRPARPGYAQRQPARMPQPRPSMPIRNRQMPAPLPVHPAMSARPPVITHVEHRTVWPQYRANTWRTQHRTWGQRGGYNGYRIPSTQFTLYFGAPHRYRLSTFEVRIVGEYPQFYADGYWFTLLDPVPEYWQGDWYVSDEVTILDTEDGYYLINSAYPDDELALSVQLP